jgi:broad specificity phosphatase PhoE
MHITHSFIKKFSLVSGAFVFMLMAAGCGDDSKSATAPESNVPESSASVEPSSQENPVLSSAATTEPVTQSSSATATNPDSGSSTTDTTKTEPQNPDTTTTVVSSSSAEGSAVETKSFNRDPAAAGLALTADADGFYDVGDIYKAVPADGQITFVLRHAEREADLGKESPLTEVGQQQALDVGAKLASEEQFYYASTDFVRTRTTAKNIATGHGEASAVVDTLSIINGGYFLTVPTDTLDALVSKRGGSFKYVSMWCYEQPFPALLVSKGLDTYFYDLFERGDQFVNEVILANLPNWKRVNVLISHDLLTEPLAVYASNRTIDLKTYETYRWINYVAGIAVIVTGDIVTILPARGVERGYLNKREKTEES